MCQKWRWFKHLTVIQSFEISTFFIVHVHKLNNATNLTEKFQRFAIDIEKVGFKIRFQIGLYLD